MLPALLIISLAAPAARAAQDPAAPDDSAAAAADPAAAAPDPTAGSAGGTAADAAEPAAAAPARKLRVGTKPSPPFVVQKPDGSWGGLSVELWQLVASDMGQQYVLQPYEQVSGLLDAVERGELDLAIGALTITPEREDRLDFSAPFYRTGLGVAVRDEPAGPGAGGVLRALLGPPLLVALVALAVLAALLLAAVRAIERRAAGGPAARLRRVAGAAWGIAAAVAVALVAGMAGSRATVEQVAREVRGEDDLAHVRVATVPGSTSAGYLDGRRIAYRPVASPLDGLRALGAGEIDAVVYDQPILDGLVAQVRGIEVLPGVFEPQAYGFAVPAGSPLLEELDRHLETRLAGDTWRQLLRDQLGER